MTRRAFIARSAAAAALGAAALALGATGHGREAAGAYLVAFVYALSLGLGALFLVMIANVTGARWFVALRRLVDAGLATMPLFALLFVPVALVAPALYPWAAPGGASAGEFAHRRAYLNVPFFVARAAVYFVAWVGLAGALRRASIAQDGADPPTAARLVGRMRAVSGGGLPLAALTVTFASFDWLMSLEPRWSSTVFGVYVFAGSMVGALALLAVATYFARRAGLLAPEVGPSHVQAVGKLLLTFTIFWAYIAFCQLLLVWIANLPEEVPWYLRRSDGGWAVVCVLLALGHFALPLGALLSWRLKRSPGALAAAAGWLLAMHYLDVAWLVLPSLGVRGPLAALLDAAALVAVGGALAAFVAWRAPAAPLVARGDPLLPLALSYEDT